MSMFSSITTSSVCEQFISWAEQKLKKAKSPETKRVLRQLLKELRDLKGSADAGYE